MVTRLKKMFTAIPASVTQAGSYLYAIGQKQKEINTAKKKAKVAIAKIETELAVEIAPLIKERDTLFTALYAFAQGKKPELTATARSVKIGEGAFGWRWTPPAVVVVPRFSEQDAILWLHQHNMHPYVTTTYSLNRELLLKERPDIACVTYVSREEFFAKPKLIAQVDGNAQELSKETKGEDRGETEAIDV